MISIVIPVFNQHDMTQECLTAVLDHTQNCEIILVDNGSEPPIKPPFSGFTEIMVIRNEENKGFPVAVNQGIRAAKGDVIVLLNNDCIVTPGWADRLINHLEDYAIIGPMTNYCAGKQQVSLPTYQSIEGLNKEASANAEANAGESEEVNWVIGFCMAFRKELYNELGEFDESLWPCSGEEIDFCLRARKAGHKVGIAHDVYVHHEGSKTFNDMEKAGQLDYQEICKRNDAHLAAKWGDDFWQQQAAGEKHHTVTWGEYSYADGGLDVSFIENAGLSIGKFCSIGKGCKVILGGNHRGDWISTFPFSALFPDSPDIADYQVSKGDVAIGNDVWIGAGVTILSGVTIGDGAIIGAGSVVVKDVAPYIMVAGNPARFKKRRFDAETIKQLLEVQWWDFPEDEIRKIIPILMSGDIEKLLSLKDGKAAA
jgi:acetyltransferase-like isoleucine patch superfamily enzyme